MKRGIGIAVLAVAVTTLTIGDRISGAASNSTGHTRYERALKLETPWESSCEVERPARVGRCEVVGLLQLTVSTPRDVQRVDVVATLALDYQTTESDWAELRTAFGEVDSGSLTAMSPGLFPIMSPSPDHFTSTSLVWIKRGLPAAGRKYTFLVDVYPRDGSGDDEVTVRGTELSFVLETWRSGA